ncbi:hypothetical protein OG402_41400 [Streptomyces anulatus]|uniref:hypothetical protein n=1 Tax=Streptomyces anulatus TaxID=1892 RepID=UPI00224E628C|nr:hypothetical protein [Streptomyces anulatus]MCX4606887.1 hypothetical protein [Streptomyces anulatus]
MINGLCVTVADSSPIGPHCQLAYSQSVRGVPECAHGLDQVPVLGLAEEVFGAGTVKHQLYEVKRCPVDVGSRLVREGGAVILEPGFNVYGETLLGAVGWGDNTFRLCGLRGAAPTAGAGAAPTERDDPVRTVAGRGGGRPRGAGGVVTRAACGLD